MITIVDYGLGNINAFANAYRRINVAVKIAKCAEDLMKASKIILPGVGYFDYAISQLDKSGMREVLDDLVLNKKVPVLGICSGMQIMAYGSEEGIEKGLCWINAKVKKIDETKIEQKTKIPHMGWNDVKSINSSILFDGLEHDAVFYFLHSFYFECINSHDIIAVTDYGIQFASAINHENIYGVQFHPEKSHSFGELLLSNFDKL